jgi:hypothetical protein
MICKKKPDLTTRGLSQKSDAWTRAHSEKFAEQNGPLGAMRPRIGFREAANSVHGNSEQRRSIHHLFVRTRALALGGVFVCRLDDPVKSKELASYLASSRIGISAWRQGRGCGVGRGRGVGVCLGVEVGVGVAVAVAVGVGVGLTCGQLKISIEAIMARVLS